MHTKFNQKAKSTLPFWKYTIYVENVLNSISDDLSCSCLTKTTTIERRPKKHYGNNLKIFYDYKYAQALYDESYLGSKIKNKRKGKRSGAILWQTPLNDRKCMGEITKRRHKNVRIHNDYGPT